MSIKLNDHLVGIQDFFSPKIVGEINDMYIKVVKIKGDEIPFHTHENSDEFFYVLAGTLIMQVEDETPFEMNPGELYVVKRSLRHKVSSTSECQIMLIEQKSTLHTGNVSSPITKSIDEQR